ncbi:hypothetical protein N7504_000723 [Penicillium tannophilum]|nr:hypothetical protein N7504_000723 [Penicillium tannophilum]
MPTKSLIYTTRSATYLTYVHASKKPYTYATGLNESSASYTPEDSMFLEYISKNTSVGISAYVVHQNPAIIPEPETCRPERWLGDAGKEFQPYFVAFSADACGCIGRNISHLEHSVLLASLIVQFEFVLSSPEWEPSIREGKKLNSGLIPLNI